jgi:hypothetical protein
MSATQTSCPSLLDPLAAHCLKGCHTQNFDNLVSPNFADTISRSWGGTVIFVMFNTVFGISGNANLFGQLAKLPHCPICDWAVTEATLVEPKV